MKIKPFPFQIEFTVGEIGDLLKRIFRRKRKYNKNRPLALNIFK